jgi:hypothetical protein
MLSCTGFLCNDELRNFDEIVKACDTAQTCVIRSGQSRTVVLTILRPPNPVATLEFPALNKVRSNIFDNWTLEANREIGPTHSRGLCAIESVFLGMVNRFEIE